MAWTIGNFYLNEPQMKGNASMFYDLVKPLGWSDEAIAGMLGNFETESTINPGIWQSLTVDTSKGFGLAQWTPATKYINYVAEYFGAAADYTQPIYQVNRILHESNNTSLAWFDQPRCPIPEHPITLKEYFTSTLPPGTLARYWLWYYERPAQLIDAPRVADAEKWYTYLTGKTPADPLPLPGEEQEKRKLPWYFYYLSKRRF